MLALFCLLAASVHVAEADCLFYQDCISGAGCMPHSYPNGSVLPFPINPGPVFNACPAYVNNGCCTVPQVETLYVSFAGLKAAFGKVASGGCPACYENLVSFWCEFTCSPNQTDFIERLGYANVTDPNTGILTDVLQVVIATDPAFTCSAYDSCAAVSTVQKDATLASMEGFFNYQGNFMAIQHGVQIIFDFESGGRGNSSNATGVGGTCAAGTRGARGGGGVGEVAAPAPSKYIPLSSPAYSCCDFPLSLQTGLPADAGVNTSCPCSNCRGMCAGGLCPWNGARAGDGGGAASFPGLGDVADNVMNGFDSLTVGVTYGAVAAASLALFGYRFYFPKKRPQEGS